MVAWGVTMSVVDLMVCIVFVIGVVSGIGVVCLVWFVVGGWVIVVFDWVFVLVVYVVTRGDVVVVVDCDWVVVDALVCMGWFDVVVNVVGVWGEGFVEEIIEVEWDWVVDVNLKGIFFVCRVVIALLVVMGGSIVNLLFDVGI